ncbi:sugar phosphate isomerase/epimerase [Dyadobacter sp. CY107]|uniref:sugar phosphate isomerase/epimerase family protein n=1 Tax=Dyadobacter fanqingshengii TaxID=2906443 RepID=UPI001F426C4A|nr:sugar phosphate isomerase/epimerase family protein [Dyadobacter fanqingshengii]MCF2505249.1 sugar phosphate isomerase/epimerase [Dyadobacter fanqingshengii]
MLDFKSDRRQFLRSGAMLTGLFVSDLFTDQRIVFANDKNVKVSAHLWVYASKYPPDWNCTPILGQAFSDIKSAGFDGIELMDVLLRADDAVNRIAALSKKYDLPVTGCSFGADMWNKGQHDDIIKVATRTIERLHALGGETFGVSVGNAKHLKTPQELDAQADVLMKLIPICEKNSIVLNLHNHTYEVENDLHDLKGTLSRIPDIKLGPDLNWLVRGGVDPVWFINTYGHQIVYMHLRNQKASGKWSESLEEGVTDFKGISQALKKQNYKGRVAVELAFDEPTTRSLPENWKKSRDYVTQVFGW